tara:strand:+ start:113 stop:484 length:372 start_codon:yes stop_codon:yes gene_type:complete
MSHKTLTGATQGKIWGQTSCFFENSSCEVHYIEADQDGFCSRHKHQNKWNRFIVLEGALKVIIYQQDSEDETILYKGMFSDVPPNVEHRFEALENTKALEIYWVDPIERNDIIRFDSGGVYDD